MYFVKIGFVFTVINYLFSTLSVSSDVHSWFKDYYYHSIHSHTPDRQTPKDLVYNLYDVFLN